MDPQNQRESFGSRLGFILVSAGCAIGIGNVWRFPTVTGQYGGGIFVLFYLLFLVLMGLPVLTMELAVGRAGRGAARSAYKALEPGGSKWHIHGWFCMAGCVLLMMYYTTVSGWMVDYFFRFLTGSFDGVKLVDYEAGVQAGRIVSIDDKCLDDFVQAVYDQRVGDGTGIEQLKLVYTPLNGTGLECVKKLLAKLGVTHVTVVPEQETPDGNFPTCPYPNPEIREAMQKGLELCDKVHPDLLLGTDPDCDRCGTAVPNGKGGYRLITGNEMGIILLDYICRTRLARGTMPKDPVAVTTIVSTDMATPVAKKYGVELRRTLTGFKFIGEQIGKLEAEGHVECYIFGFEESYGYLSGGHVRDKDAVNATLLVCEAAAWYAQQGMTLLDAIEALYKEFGYYRNALCSFAFEGETGMYTMQNLMKTLRADPPKEIAGYAVERVADYDTDGTGLPRANVLEYHLAGGHKLMVRPSGTEPKIKVYLSAVGKSEAEADAVNAELAKAAEMLMK